jgi:hypothetical protein
MKNSLVLFAVATMFFVFGCKKEESTPVTPVVTDPLATAWVSEGANLAPGFLTPTFKLKKIAATFNSDKSYTVVSTDSSNTTVTYKGTYTTTESSVTDTASTSNTKGAKIIDIVLTQTTPGAVTSTGIYAISGTNLRYEVIQTTPAITGFAAPTAAGGFGSTSYNTFKLGVYWIQKFVKQ